MARTTKAPASEDIWHLSIEDLLGAPSEPPQTAGPGPFVINLRKSTTAIASLPRELLRLRGLHVYQLARHHEGQREFRLRLGIIETELQAGIILSKVRDHYPAAVIERVGDEDKAAVLGAAGRSELVKPAAGTGAKARVVQQPPKIAATPAQPAVKSATDDRWDINEVLPDLPVAQPPRRERKPPNRTSSEVPQAAKPVPTTPTASAKPRGPPRTAAAPRARPSAKSGETPPPPQSPPVAPDQVPAAPRIRVGAGRPTAKTRQAPEDVLRPAPQAKNTPAPAAAETIDLYPTLTVSDAITAASRPSTVNNTESSFELKLLEDSVFEPAQPKSELRRTQASAPTKPQPVVSAGSRTVDSVPTKHPAAVASRAPTAAANAKRPVPSGKDSGAPQSSVTRTAAPDGRAGMREKSANTRVAAAPRGARPEPAARAVAGTVALSRGPQPAIARAPAPPLDSTQTIRALTPLELADDDEESRWFAIQLTLSEDPVDAEQVPNLDIFTEYRLYSVTGLEDRRVMHALRVGFFSNALAAEAVAAYLTPHFEKPVVKRVSIAERERFADRRVTALKDVGATGLHAKIEVLSPAPLEKRRRSDVRITERVKRPAVDENSLWTRLRGPRKR